MPAFLLVLPSNARFTLPDAATAVVVFADSSADAVAVAQAEFQGDSNAAWAAATVTTLDEPATVLGGVTLKAQILTLSTPVLVEVTSTDLQLGGVTFDDINAAGTAYVDDDILTVIGGTGRAATLRVINETAGVIDAVNGLELVDPGDYTVLPSLTANAVTGGTGSAATVDLFATTDQYINYLARAVTLLNADAQVAGAALDLGEAGIGATDLRFLMASGGGGDDLGDETIVAHFARNGIEVPSLLGALTHEGVSTAVLAAVVTAAAVRTLPESFAILKSV